MYKSIKWWERPFYKLFRLQIPCTDDDVYEILCGVLGKEYVATMVGGSSLQATGYMMLEQAALEMFKKNDRSIRADIVRQLLREDEDDDDDDDYDEDDDEDI